MVVSVTQAAEQLDGPINTVIEKANFATVAVFTHGMAIKCLLRGIEQSNPALTHKRIVTNTSITELKYSTARGGAGGWFVERVNDSSHLTVTVPPTVPDSAEGEIHGECLCGGVRWFVPPGVGAGQMLVCNCGSCRQQTGAQSILFASFPREEVRFAANSTLREICVSPVAKRFFCIGCGAFVYMDYHETHTIWLSLGLVGTQAAQALTTEYQARLAQPSGEPGRHAYPPSGIFRESVCGAFQDYAAGFPLMAQFGTYVNDSCEPTEERKTAAARDDC